MKTTARAAVALIVLAGLALAGATGLRAASPSPVPIIGGDLNAYTDRVVVTSRSTFPVSVTVTPEAEDVTVTPSAFRLDPGESIELTVEGDARGMVAAKMESIRPAGEGDTSGVTLEVAFPAPLKPSPPWPWIVASIVGLIVLSVALMRLRPWEWRVTRASP